MGKKLKGIAGLLLAVALPLFLGSHAACSSDDTARGGDDADAAVATTTEALTLPPINAAADTSIRQAFQYANDGTGVNLSVSSVAGAGQRSLIRFSQTAIASAVGSQSLYRAQVELTIKTLSEGWGGGELAMHAMIRTWPEGNGTFSPPGSHGPSWRCADDTDTSTFGNLVNNCTPANLWGMDPMDPDPIPFNPNASDTTRLYGNGMTVLRFDVTADVRRFLAGDPNNGFIIKDTAGPLHGAWVNFGSRETTTPPKLILDVGPDQCPADPNKVQPGRCGCGTPETDTDADGEPDCVEPALAPVADTTLRLAVPNGNDGLGVNLGVTSASVVSLERTLIRFDQNELERLAAGCTVTNAELELKVSGIAIGWNGGAIEIRRMTRHWPEGVGLDVTLGAHGPSWRCADDSNTSIPGNASNDCATSDIWGMRTTDPGPTPFVSTVTDTEPIFTATTTQVRFDVTADVQSFLTGTANYGWIIKGTDGPFSGAWVNFGSRETETGPILRLTLDTSGNCGDRDGDGLSDDSEINDADPWTDPDVFNGMQARSANRCHATPTCAAIDTVAEVNTCTTPPPRETKNQAGGWSWQNPSSADICSPGYGFRPEWSVCGVDWQVDWQGFIKLDNSGQHCFRVTGDTSSACGSAFFNNATTGFTPTSGVQCFNAAAGVYPIRWFYETSGGPKTDFRLSYCYGGGQACDPTEAVPTRLLRPQHSPGDPLCDPQAPNCTDLCPCNPGKPCSSDANCGSAQTCGVNNGGHFGLARDARACWSPQCDVNPQAIGCGFTNAPCGACENVRPCTTSADCPADNVCGSGNGVQFNSAHQNVCWPAGCATNPAQTGCGTPESPCGLCSCTPNCAGKQCGDDPSDGCGGTCAGFCQDRQPGCTADWQCGSGSVCVMNGGPRVGLLPNTNVCLPAACNDFDVTRIPDCGSTTSVCGTCPTCISTCVEDGRDCGTDPRCGVSCGTCSQNSFCNADGKCVESTTETLSFVEPADTAGATPGSFAVSDRGTAVYSVPIQAPSGINGFTPQLSLRYTSGKSNGLIGVGWSLEGLSAISRCPRTEAQDGYGRGVGWGDSGDAFCLDGQRLTAVSGQYGHDGTEYRTEIDTFTKVVSTGQTGPAGNPESFIAYTKAGDILHYGISSDSSAYFDVGTVPRKYKWAVKRIVDRSNNAIVVNYGRFILPLLSGSCSACNTEEIWPQSISYGGQISPSGAVPMDREIRFVYTKERADSLVGYASPGLRISRTRLLERVETYIESGLVRSYSLAYEQSPVPNGVAGESRLTAITECAQDKISLANVQMQCAPPTTFGYGFEEGFSSPPLVLNIGAGLSNESPLAPVIIVRDLDGDGLDDLVYRPNGSSNVRFALATGNRSAPLTTISPGPIGDLSKLSATAVVDHQGDGDDDLLDPSPQFPTSTSARFTLLWSAFNGSTFNGVTIEHVMIPLRVAGGSRDRYAIVDVDGNERKDFLVCAPSGELSYFVGTGEPGGLYIDLPEHGDCVDLVRQPRTLDVDGDGVPDLIAGDGPGADWAFLRHEPPFTWIPFQLDATHSDLEAGRLKFGDVNGDGLQDVVELAGISFNAPNPIVLHLNTGGGRFERQFTSATVTRNAFDGAQLIDYDGDGDEDLLATQADLENWTVIRSPEGFATGNATPIGLSVPPPNRAGETLPLSAIADLDGDSNRDLIVVDSQAQLHIQFGAGARSNLLTRVTDGFGKQIEISYDAVRASARTYAAGSECAWPARCVRDPGPLVREHRISQVTQGGPVKFEGSAEYTYVDARADVQGRGWLGFSARRVAERHGAGTLIRFTDLTYDNHTQVKPSYYPFAGLVEGSVVVSGLTTSPGLSASSVRVASSALDWEFRALRGEAFNPEGFAFLKGRITTVAEIKSGTPTLVPLTSTIESFDVDGFGNVKDHEQRAYVVREGVDVTNPSHASTRTVVHRIFEPTPAQVDSWLIGLPRTETVEDIIGESKVRQSDYGYDSRGLLTDVTRALGGPANLTRRIDLERDGFGNVEFVKLTTGDVLGDTLLVSVEYDARGRYPEVVTNALAQPTQLRYDARHGALSRSTDPKGRTNTWDYDGFGRLQQHVSPYSQTSVSYQAASFDSTGMLPVHAVQRITATEDGQGTTEVDVDAFGRVVRSNVPGYQGTRVLQEHEYDYADDSGAVARHARPHLPGTTNQGIVEQEFDAIGRIFREAYPDNTSVSYLYATHANVVPEKSSWFTSSNAVEAQMRVNPRGHTDSMVFDVRGNPISNIDGLDHTTHYQYVGFNTLRQIIDAQDNVTSVTADDYGRRLSMTDPDMGTHTFTWNARDELADYTDGNTVPGGLKTRFFYDDLGRLRVRADEDGHTDWIYDGTGPNEIGELVETRSPTGQRVRYGYEAVNPTRNRGLLSSITRTINNGGVEENFTTSFRYDNFSRLDEVQYPGAANQSFGVRYAYDDNSGATLNVIDTTTNQSLWSFVQADQGYRIGIEQYGNGLRRDVTYEPLTGLLSTLKSTSTGGTVLEDIRYFYDSNGNVRQRHNPRRDRLENFTYDPLDRLGSVITQTLSTGALTTHTYGYDAIGNITSHPTVGAFTYGPTRPHAVATAGPNGYLYDGNGNQFRREGPEIAGGAVDIQYTSFDMPKVLATPTETHEIKYDADQLRVLKTGPQGTTMYAEGLYERRTGSTPGTAVHKYLIHVGGRQVAQVDRTEQGGAITTTSQSFLQGDLLGSTHLITDASGGLVHEQQFDPFGKSDSPAFDTTNVSTGFTGHEHDPELGLINMQGRLYDPHIGRFITPDPFIQAPFWSQGLNRYSYVANNPMNFTDPSGFWMSIILKGLLPSRGGGGGGSGSGIVNCPPGEDCAGKKNDGGSQSAPAGDFTGNPIVDLTGYGVFEGGVTGTAPGSGAMGGGTAGGAVPGGDGYISGGGPLGPHGAPAGMGGGFRPPNSSPPGGGNFDNGGGFYNDWLPGQQSPDPRMMRSNQIGNPPAAGASALVVACLANPICAAELLVGAIVTYAIVQQTEAPQKLLKILQQPMADNLLVQPPLQASKVPKPGVSGKEGAKDVPSWAKGHRPEVGESGKDFAGRLLDGKYGPGKYPTGPGSEHNAIRKWGDRAFQDP